MTTRAYILEEGLKDILLGAKLMKQPAMKLTGAFKAYVDEVQRVAQGIIDEANEEDPIDPTPYCSACGSPTKSGCHCGPMASNE